MTDLSVIDEKQFPPQIRNLMDVIGLSETLSLLEALGGMYVYVPQTPGNSKLSQVIAETSLHALCAAFGGQHLELPKADKILTQLRDTAIRNERDELSINALAQKYKLSRRRIIQICQSGSECNPTLPLF